MNPKQLFGLLGVLLVLLALAYLTGVFERDASTVDVPDVAIPADDLERVRIASPDQTLALQRQGTRWLLTEPVQAPADSATAARFVQDLGDLELGSVASTNPERYARYGVDSTASVVEAAWAGGARRLVIGNQGADFQSVYVRLDDDPAVYATRSRISVPEPLDRWRDKTVVALPRGAVASVAVEGPDRAFGVHKGPGGWQVDAQGATAPADSAAVARWLQHFAPMRADGFFEAVPVATVRDSAAYRLAFTLTTGATETLHLLQRDGAYAVTDAAGATTFRLSAARLSTYVPDPETLK